MRFAAPAVIFLFAGAALAAPITIHSGDSSIHAFDGTGSPGSAVRTSAYGFGGGDATHFRTLTPGDFAAAQLAPTATNLVTGIPGAWGTLAGATWIHNDASAINAGGGFDNAAGQSVLYAIPFNIGNASKVSISITYLTDNGLGNANGGNGSGVQLGFSNNGLFVNGSDAQVAYSSPGTSGQPAEFLSPILLSFGNVSVIPNAQNWLYFYQFNWGGPGGSAFNIEINTIPLPLASLMSMAGLGVVGLRRRRSTIA